MISAKFKAATSAWCAQDRFSRPAGDFKSPAFSGANLVTLCLYAAIGIFFFLFPLNLIQVQGYSATAAGAAVLPLILLIFMLSRWSGGVVARYGPSLPLIIGPVIATLGFALFAIPSIEGSYWSALSRAQAIRVKLGGSPDMSEAFPAKPKGMHWRNYHRLRMEAFNAADRSWPPWVLRLLQAKV